MNPFDDDNMFLRHIRQQIQDAQGGNLKNERLMKSLNRPTNMPMPFHTQTIPGNPGRFASPQPLNYPGSEIPKTNPVILPMGLPSPMQQFMAAQKPGIDPLTRQWDREDQQQSNSNIIPFLLKSLMGR